MCFNAIINSQVSSGERSQSLLTIKKVTYTKTCPRSPCRAWHAPALRYMQACNYASYGCPPHPLMLHASMHLASEARPRGSLRSCCMRSCRGNFLHVFLIKMKI
jgi:hypothetical protein